MAHRGEGDYEEHVRTDSRGRHYVDARAGSSKPVPDNPGRRLITIGGLVTIGSVCVGGTLICGGGAIDVLKRIAGGYEQNQQTNVNDNRKERERADEEERMVNGINEFMEPFHLPKFTRDRILMHTLSPEDWEAKSKRNFDTSQLQTTHYIYGQLVEMTARDVLLGKHYKSVIAGVGYTDGLPYHFSTGWDQKVHLPQDLEDAPNAVEWALIHEIWHLLAPRLYFPGFEDANLPDFLAQVKAFKSFPRDKIFKLLLREAEALHIFQTLPAPEKKRLFAYPGEFVESEVGRSIAKHFRGIEGKKFQDIVSDLDDAKQLTSIINQIALDKKTKGASDPNFRITKDSAIKIGLQVMGLFRQGKLSLQGEPKRFFVDSSNRALHEVWAQIGQFVLWPDANNAAVSGRKRFIEIVQEVLTIIQESPENPQPNVNIQEIKSRLKEVTNSIKSEYDKEMQTRHEEKSKSITPSSPDEKAIVLEQNIKVFAEAGTLPNSYLNGLDKPENKKLLQQFAIDYRNTIRLHPVLRNTAQIAFDTSFDPDTLDFWDTERLEQAMDTNFSRDFVEALINNQITQDLINQVKQRDELLQSYLKNKTLPRKSSLKVNPDFGGRNLQQIASDLKKLLLL